MTIYIIHKYDKKLYIVNNDTKKRHELNNEEIYLKLDDKYGYLLYYKDKEYIHINPKILMGDNDSIINNTNKIINLVSTYNRKNTIYQNGCYILNYYENMKINPKYISIWTPKEIKGIHPLSEIETNRGIITVDKLENTDLIKDNNNNLIKIIEIRKITNIIEFIKIKKNYFRENIPNQDTYIQIDNIIYNKGYKKGIDLIVNNNIELERIDNIEYIVEIITERKSIVKINNILIILSNK